MRHYDDRRDIPEDARHGIESAGKRDCGRVIVRTKDCPGFDDVLQSWKAGEKGMHTKPHAVAGANGRP